VASRLLSHERLRPYATALTAAWLMYWFFLCGLTHAPKLPRVPITISKEGLVAHFTAYFILAAACVIARIARIGQAGLAWMATWTAVFAAYAALDEITQPLTNRDASPWDFCADAIGVITCMLICRLLLLRPTPGTCTPK
jgi:VanZ family protein